MDSPNTEESTLFDIDKISVESSSPLSVSYKNLKRPKLVSDDYYSFKDQPSPSEITGSPEPEEKSTLMENQEYYSSALVSPERKKRKITKAVANDYFSFKNQSNCRTPKMEKRSPMLNLHGMPTPSSSMISLISKKTRRTKPAADGSFSFKKYIKTIKTMIKPTMMLSGKTLVILDQVLQNKLDEILDTLRQIRRLSKKKTLTTEDLDHVTRLTFPQHISKITTEYAKTAVLISLGK